MAKATHSTAQDKHIDTTIEAIDEHVKKNSTTVLTTISSWITTLESHEEFKEISTDLEALKEALSEKDGAKIVSLMEKLGKAATEAGQKAEGTTGTKVKALGKALTVAAKAAAKLS